MRKPHRRPARERSYVVYSRSWYAQGVPLAPDRLDEIALSDGDHGEILIVMSRLGAKDGGPAHPELQVFGEAWYLFSHWLDLFTSLSRLGTPVPSLSEIERVLRLHGFVDRTKVQRAGNDGALSGAPSADGDA